MKNLGKENQELKTKLAEISESQAIAAVAILINTATFGSVPLYEDGQETPNRILLLNAAKWIHSLISTEDFETDHKWLLDQIKLHPCALIGAEDPSAMEGTPAGHAGP